MRHEISQLVFPYPGGLIQLPIFIMNIDRKRRLTRQAPSLTEALQRYLAEEAIKKRSYSQAKSLFRVWEKTVIAGRSIASVTPADLIRIRDDWELQYAPATVCRRLTLVSHMYTVAMKDWGFTWLKNPASLVRRPMVSDARDRRLFDQIRLRGVSDVDCPRSELDWIINATRSKQLPTILWLAVETAMRRSELARIKREHIDLTRGTIFVPYSKNGQSRSVPLSPWAKYVLRLYLTGRKHRGRIFGLSSDGITKTFIRARKMARQNYDQLCAERGRLPQAAYFMDLRFHDLRHEATSRLAGVYELHELAKITGHSDTRMLLRYYHPKGYELARKLAKSELGRRQIEHIRMLAAPELKLAA